jgi:hypothetical protein
MEPLDNRLLTAKTSSEAHLQSMITCCRNWPAVICILAFAHLSAWPAVHDSSEEREFFETKIRPLLAERCFGCHSTHAKKLKGGLLLDSRAGLLQGGEDGAVVKLGHPEQSRLIAAIRYSDVDLQMPPKGKLPDQQIADLTAWIKMGAPWPGAVDRQPVSTGKGFDLEKLRQSHWAWQPIQPYAPPPVRHGEWGRGPVDDFILARLETNGLAPAPPAEKPSLLRRVCFDLNGLPPTPALLEQFLNDPSPDAYEKIVDRLLASPQFGERWARHWLDLVRYAETLGHEFDYPNPNAWRYRDYVIRALNADVPYDQFVLEHIAGDLVDAPRRNLIEHFNESVIGTAFYWLGQRDHSPVDVRQHQAEIIANQIDVLTKTFLGLTVACARCHDHKFDPIPTQDYYSLYGILSSSRYTQASIESPDRLRVKIRQLTELKSELRQAIAGSWLAQVNEAGAFLASNRDPICLASFGDSGGSIEERILPRNLPWVGWFREGEAFESGPAARGEFIVGTPQKPLEQILEEPALDSHLLSARLQGVLRSPTFTITNRYLHILAAGRSSRINVPVDNFTMIRDPIYGGLKQVLNNEHFHWLTIDLGMWQGHRAYIELSDISAPDPADDDHRNGFGPAGFVAVQCIRFSNQATPPEAESSLEPFAPAATGSLASRAQSYSKAIQCAVEEWAADSKTIHPGEVALLNWLVEKKVLDASRSSEAVTLAGRYAALSDSIQDPRRVPAMVDGTGLDEDVFIRGNPKLEGERAPRRFLQAIAGPDQCAIARGSGRMELAHRILSDQDPFLARVMVNRVWLHLFGRGIVATPDDFGVLGSPPSHPELLDWLANWYRSEGSWSTKKLIRLLVTSSTYRMSSVPTDAVAEEKDPDNRLWHRMPVRRLEGEVIRDSILAVSGQLDLTSFGAPVPTHLTEFMEGRGRPSRSGPLNGARRRSIYLEVRRNFVSPMMRTFDMPVPFTTVGRRTVSNVPAQSLILMNDPFVVEEAKRWAVRVLAEPGLSAEARMKEMYLEAFGRPPSEPERAAGLAFLRKQAEAYGQHEAAWERSGEAWADFAHVLFNVKEFIFVN